MVILFNFSYALLVSLLKYFICRLLTAGDILQMWRYADAVKFNIGETSDIHLRSDTDVDDKVS